MYLINHTRRLLEFTHHKLQVQTFSTSDKLPLLVPFRISVGTFHNGACSSSVSISLVRYILDNHTFAMWTQGLVGIGVNAKVHACKRLQRLNQLRVKAKERNIWEYFLTCFDWCRFLDLKSKKEEEKSFDTLYSCVLNQAMRLTPGLSKAEFDFQNIPKYSKNRFTCRFCF